MIDLEKIEKKLDAILDKETPESLSKWINKNRNMSDTKELSLGEQRVRTAFNPSEDGIVDQIKQKTAELINLCEPLKSLDPRLASIAQTEYESAAHWAVKAATAGK